MIRAARSIVNNVDNDAKTRARSIRGGAFIAIRTRLERNSVADGFERAAGGRGWTGENSVAPISRAGQLYFVLRTQITFRTHRDPYFSSAPPVRRALIRRVYKFKHIHCRIHCCSLPRRFFVPRKCVYRATSLEFESISNAPVPVIQTTS